MQRERREGRRETEGGVGKDTHTNTPICRCLPERRGVVLPARSRHNALHGTTTARAGRVGPVGGGLAGRLGGWPGRVGWLVRWGRVGVAGRVVQGGGAVAGRVGVGSGGDAIAGRVGWRVGWYGQATGNVHTARQGVCNCWVKNAL